MKQSAQRNLKRFQKLVKSLCQLISFREIKMAAPGSVIYDK